MNKKDLSHYSTAWMGVHKLRAGKNISISSYWMRKTERGREGGRERKGKIVVCTPWQILPYFSPQLFENSDITKAYTLKFFTKSQLKVWIPTIFSLPDWGPWHTLPDLFLSPFKKKIQEKIIFMFTLLHYFYYTHTVLHNCSEVNLIDN